MRRLGAAVGIASLLAYPFVRELRLKPAERAASEPWRHVPIFPRRSTLLGVSFRPPQVEALGLDARVSLQELLAYPFSLLRLGAYWNRIETEPGGFDPSELDRQVEAAERVGKQIILSVGALKNFSYPEFFVPAHRLARPIPEHTLVRPADAPALLSAATEFVARVVERYRDRPSVVAWQVEHDAVDPLGMEHSWRLSAAFVAREVEVVRRADPSRPIMLNGFLPTTLVARLSQWFQTRDQGDSLAVAQRLADLVGIDYYPRYALTRLGPLSLYLNGTKSLGVERQQRRLLATARDRQKRLMVSEGQAEPWEVVTIPPNPRGRELYSCGPEQLIDNYNAWMRVSPRDGSLYAYLFWGAEYWLLRQQSGDSRYLRAFARVLEES